MENNTQQTQQRSSTEQQDGGPPQSQPTSIIVSGYPGGTPARQLEEMFPGSRIETLGWRRSTLRFPTAAEAGAAVRARVSLDGAPLEVTLKRDRRQNAPQDNRGKGKRHRPPEKELEPSLDPHSIDFSGDFHQQLDAVMAHVRLNQQEVARISQLFEDVELALQEFWPGCKAHPFGSITSGLGVKGSDADCLVLGPKANEYTVGRARRLLRQYPATFRQVIAIPAANTPIVKFLHVPTNTSADVSFKTTLGVRNSRLLAFLLHADARALPLAVAIKYWGRVGGFTGSGKLTNYALTLMVLFYLQVRRVLPPVCALQSEGTAHMVDGWDTGFDARYEALPASDCAASIADLLGGFFDYYSTFDFKEFVVAPFLGRPASKSLFADPQLVPPEYELYARNVLEGRANPLRTRTTMCVQDPFEHSHNVASMVTEARAEEIIAYLAFAAAAYRQEKATGCAGLLRRILLEKPVIRVRRRLPDFRVVMREPYLRLVRGEWRDLVRDSALRVFRDILKLAPTRVEDGEKPDAGEASTRKERYLAVLTKPIWRRKDAAKYTAGVRCGLVERQVLITERILKTDPSEFSVPFILEVQTSSRRRAVVSVRAATEVCDDAGKAQIFREFGQFFLAVVQGWIYQLLDPHLVPPKERHSWQSRREGTPPRDASPPGESSSDEDYVSGGLVVENSNAQTKDPSVQTTVTNITESFQKSLGIDNEYKFSFKLDNSTVGSEEVEEGSSIRDIEKALPIDTST